MRGVRRCHPGCMVTTASWRSRFVSALASHAAAAPKPAIRVAAVLKPAAAGPAGELITPALLARLGGRNPNEWAPALSAACTAHDIATPLRVAAFLPNVMNETGDFTVLSENLNYTPASLLAQWPSHFTSATAQRYGRTAQHPANQEAIANLAYGGRGGNTKPGDGWLFRGSGGMQTTFRANYVSLAKAIGWTKPVEDLPEYLQTIEGACVSAAVFWQQARCNAPADRGDIATVRKIVNGGTIGLVPVKARYAAARAALGIH